MVSLKRAMRVNGVSCVCLTKLDVMDGFDNINICTAYRFNGEVVDSLTMDADTLEACQPEYITLPGWQSATVGVTDYAALPQNARDYIDKIEELLQTPIDIISTGPERQQNVIRRELF